MVTWIKQLWVPVVVVIFGTYFGDCTNCSLQSVCDPQKVGTPKIYMNETKGKCYAFVDDYHSPWLNAMEYCMDKANSSYGTGHLASLPDEETYLEVKSGLGANISETWIGGKQRSNLNSRYDYFWYHLPLEPLLPIGWNPTSINGTMKTNVSGMHCLEMNSETNEWRNAECSMAKKFICELSCRPETPPSNPPTYDPTDCDDHCNALGGHKIDTSCYLLEHNQNAKKRSFVSADQVCRIYGSYGVPGTDGRLARFEDYDTYQSVKAAFLGSLPWPAYWIGMNDTGGIDVVDDHKWVTGVCGEIESNLSSSFFGKTAFSSLVQQCVVVDERTVKLLHDRNCDVALGYLCELACHSVCGSPPTTAAAVNNESNTTISTVGIGSVLSTIDSGSVTATTTVGAETTIILGATAATVITTETVEDPVIATSTVIGAPEATATTPETVEFEGPVAATSTVMDSAAFTHTDAGGLAITGAQCPMLLIAHGSLDHMQHFNQHGSTKSVTCKPGFQPVTTSTTCDNGRWSTIPACRNDRTWRCPPEGASINTGAGCYWLTTSSSSWDGSFNACSGMGGSLAPISSSDLWNERLLDFAIEARQNGAFNLWINMKYETNNEPRQYKDPLTSVLSTPYFPYHKTLEEQSAGCKVIDLTKKEALHVSCAYKHKAVCFSPTGYAQFEVVRNRKLLAGGNQTMLGEKTSRSSRDCFVECRRVENCLATNYFGKAMKCELFSKKYEDDIENTVAMPASDDVIIGVRIY